MGWGLRFASLLSRLPLVGPLVPKPRGTGKRRAREAVLSLLPKNAVGAEVGVHLGDFSAMLLATARPRVLHLIDPWRHLSGDVYKKAWYGGAADGKAEMDARYHGVLDRFSAESAAGVVIVDRAESADALSRLPDGGLDWIYIDGNHLYDFVREDLALAYAKVRKGGLICGDDYGDRGWWEDGVTRAVDEFCAAKPVEKVMFIGNQFVLRTR